jgi:hypothetical protein
MSASQAKAKAFDWMSATAIRDSHSKEVAIFEGRSVARSGHHGHSSPKMGGPLQVARIAKSSGDFKPPSVAWVRVPSLLCRVYPFPSGYSRISD